MISLISADTFEVRGKTCFAVKGITGLDPRSLSGQTIELDHRVAKVLNVETFAIADATGTTFSVMVEFVPDSQPA